jgi:succinate dehydrogenase/fumarate reductase-like Fe-S protein
LLHELLRTGSLRALALQLRTGALHVAKQAFGRRRSDPVAQFLGYYGPDGVTKPDPVGRRLAQQAEACLVCGLCSLECARVGGAPPLDPRDAVVAAARLEIDWLRLGISPGAGFACGACDACARICPAGIPIHHVQTRLASLAATTSTPATPDATPARIG